MSSVTIDIEITSSTTESGLYVVDARIEGVTSAYKYEKRVLGPNISIDLTEWKNLDNALKSLDPQGFREEAQVKAFGKKLFQ